ncbi:hypothetical protein BH23PLA1_BH23PLA1_26440 [soil metagenome]
MRWLPTMFACVFLATPCWAQSFAPDQPRVVTPTSGSAPARLVPGLSTIPDPAPFGLAGVQTPRRGQSGSFLLPGGQVAIPGPPGATTTARLFTVFGTDGSRTAIYHDYATGDTIGYDLSTSVGRFARPYDGFPTAGLAIEGGTGSFSGLTQNPSVTRPPSSGIPAINSLTPSFSYRDNPFVGPRSLLPSGSVLVPGVGPGPASPSIPSAPSTMGSP